mgnify:FL=1
MGSVDTTYPYHIICNTDGIALYPSRTEPDTEASYCHRIRGNGVHSDSTGDERNVIDDGGERSDNQVDGIYIADRIVQPEGKTAQNTTATQCVHSQ